MITYVEDLLPEDYRKQLESTIDSDNFPWYYFDEISQGSYVDNNITESCAICHTVFDSIKNGVNSSIFPLVEPVLGFLQNKTQIGCSQILRIRIRRTMQTPNHTLDKYNRPHVDLCQEEPYTTLVYYLDESDGDTILFDQHYNTSMDLTAFDHSSLIITDRIKHKKNSGLVFDGLRFHAGNNPVCFKKRTIINFDFLENKEK